MRVFSLLYVILLLLAVLAASAAKPAASPLLRPAGADFLKLRRKYHRLHCHQRRCVALHSRVPFP